MKLNQFTDYGLRILMYMSRKPAHLPATTITELADQFGISRNHLVKVVQFLSNQNIIDAQRGRGGGLRLFDSAESYRIGKLVRLLEQDEELINCESPLCILAGNCGLKGILNGAQNALYQYLDQYTLDDISKPALSKTLQTLFPGPTDQKTELT
ncbi:RrF2 family transcriptional regulator [Pedobacter gandavensis]|uniref:Rrf2 family transcriptional regulator n=1 Tax=Pedobacter gandavensis TaxID=2679963 RepID=A0ABR6ERQ8_9SPHI|nr:Rrf2 family transcriptional regulator [Pedobacter gandavensis]MBB2147932.1 Rrf2 family transcriptional regulator [Pedobacter gandavensis]